MLRIVVLAGSPKGETSVTVQYVRYLERVLHAHDLKIVQISQPIKQIESDTDAFDAVIADVADSDLVLWAFPLYFMLVPSQYKRFVELIWERSAEHVFRHKYAAVLTTSIHFFD